MLLDVFTHSHFFMDATDASPVTDLRCEGPNTKNARLLLSWKVPKGQHSGFQVAVNDSEMITSTGTCCNQTVPNLLHYTVYKPRVVTLSCGRPSVPVIHVCRTGITGSASRQHPNDINVEKL